MKKNRIRRMQKRKKATPQIRIGGTTAGQIKAMAEMTFGIIGFFQAIATVTAVKPAEDKPITEDADFSIIEPKPKELPPAGTGNCSICSRIIEEEAHYCEITDCPHRHTSE